MVDEAPPDSKKARSARSQVFTHVLAALLPILTATIAAAATNWPALHTFLLAICPK